MAAVTMATVAKKAAEILVSSKNGRKFIGYVIGIVLILILLPLIALIGLFGVMSGGEMPIDTEQIMAALPAEDKAIIQKINTTGNDIVTTFSSRGLTENDSKKAQTIYIACLIGKESDSFVTDLAICFESVSDTVSVYGNISEKFSITFSEEDKQYFDEKYGFTRKIISDTSG